MDNIDYDRLLELLLLFKLLITEFPFCELTLIELRHRHVPISEYSSRANFLWNEIAIYSAQ